MKNTLCSLCKSSLVDVFQINGYPIFECQSCHHRMTPPVKNTYSDDYFTGGGAGYPDYLSYASQLTEKGEWYSKKLKAPGNLLDVGCASGFTTLGFQNSGWKVTGIKPNQTMAGYGKNQLKLNIIHGPIEEFHTEDFFDAIAMIQVIAHLENPDQVIKNLAKKLNPGGLILVETWNYKSIFANLFGKRWHEYSPPTVLHWFSPKSLEKLMLKHELVKIEQGQPKKKISLGHARSLMKYKWGIDFFPDFLDHRTILYPSFDLFYSIFRSLK